MDRKYLIILYQDSSVAAIWKAKLPIGQDDGRLMDTVRWNTEILVDSIPNCSGEYYTEYIHKFTIEQSDLR